MKIAKFLSIVLLLTVFTGCKEDKTVPEEIGDNVVSTFFFIRHAEKDRSNPDNVDPELNQDGLGRAMKWAEVLDNVPLDAIYSTDFERTTMTAAPAAVKKDITVQYYDPDQIDIEQFKAVNQGYNVLVVGHSHSTPEFVNKMIGIEKYNALDDSDNASLFIVQIVGNQTTDLQIRVD
ncbi:SixA phosphatase family protein [Spongiimicrobium sp. 3-5]|uniref:SixA phosphatase family protein n=1 Tax=Spongiimicrobium sp. 3-5 TaxID=3332596 RepID=UPI0039818A52